MEWDNFDLLVGEAHRGSAPAAGDSRPAGVQPDYITMSRWQLDPASGKVGSNWGQGFNYCRTGGAGVMAPRGLWTYGERMTKGATSTPRPLAAFRDGAIFTCTDTHAGLCRIDFTPESIAAFGGEWNSHRQKLYGTGIKDKRAERGYRRLGRVGYWLLREHEDPNNATWMADDVFGEADLVRNGGQSPIFLPEQDEKIGDCPRFLTPRMRSHDENVLGVWI